LLEQTSESYNIHKTQNSFTVNRVIDPVVLTRTVVPWIELGNCYWTSARSKRILSLLALETTPTKFTPVVSSQQ